MASEISRIIDVVYTRCFEGGCFTSIHEVDSGAGYVTSSVQVEEDDAGLPSITDTINLEGVQATKRLLIAQARVDFYSIIFEVSSSLPECTVNEIELLRFTNRIHEVPGQGRVHIDPLNRMWKCHARLDLFEGALGQELVDLSNSPEVLSSPEIEIALNVLLGVLSTVKQFDRLFREQLLR